MGVLECVCVCGCGADTGISVSATKGFDAEAEEEAGVDEHVEEDKKPFDAATSLLIFHDGSRASTSRSCTRSRALITSTLTPSSPSGCDA
jgi:hypothetical protein